MLQEAVGEATGAGPEVDASVSPDIESEVPEGVLELVASSRHVTVASVQFQPVAFADPVAGLAGRVPVDPHLSGHDGPLGLGARLAEAPVHEGLVDPDPHVR